MCENCTFKWKFLEFECDQSFYNHAKETSNVILSLTLHTLYFVFACISHKFMSTDYDVRARAYLLVC
jgi:hypothetical protein